jgi:hypothetical protein
VVLGAEVAVGHGNRSRGRGWGGGSAEPGRGCCSADQSSS